MKRRSYADCDMSMVDRLVVEWVCQGTRMRLNADERVYAVRCMLGRVPTGEIAHRIGTYDREVTRIARALDTVLCPVCQQYAYHDAGVLDVHMDQQGVARCAMAGCHYQDQEAIDARQGWYAGSERPEHRSRRAQRTAVA